MIWDDYGGSIFIKNLIDFIDRLIGSGQSNLLILCIYNSNHSMIWPLNSLFYRENTVFKEEGHASSKLMLFTWFSMAHYPPVSQERVLTKYCARSKMRAQLVVRGKKALWAVCIKLRCDLQPYSSSGERHKPTRHHRTNRSRVQSA